MWKQLLGLGLAIGSCASELGCEKKRPDDHAERERLFRDRQRTLAIKAYRDLTTKFPDSPYAAMAKERLQALQAQEKK
jgi:outer membrane protein assembly factor BamD (BamD/ComL family)